MVPKEHKRTESGSSLSVFRTCPKKYSYQIEEKLSPKGYSSSLGFGSFVHGSVAILNAGSLGSDRFRELALEQEAFYQEMITANPDERSRIDSDRLLAEKVATLWNEYWNGNSSPLRAAQLEFTEVEQEWKFELPSGFHVGKRDGLIRHREWGKTFLYELKTAASRDESNYLDRLSLDSQIDSNLLALHQEGKAVAGVIYDIIWKPAIRLKTGRKTMPDETLAEFHERTLEEYRKSPSDYFQRVEIDRSSAHLQSYLSELEEQFHTLDTQAVRYRNTASCMNFGKKCSFFDLCRDPDLAEELKKSFTIREKKLVELK